VSTLAKLDKIEVSALLPEINPSFEGGAFATDTTTILGQDLSFYPDYRFLDISDYSITPAPRKFVVFKPGDVAILDWTNVPIYSLNERAPIKLDKGNVVDYVRFFFSYIKGRHGRFIIVENVDDVLWSEEPPAAARKAIGQMMVPTQVKGIDDDGTFHLSACMVFKDSLFRADIHVSRKGTVDLSNEELLIEDMPVVDETLG